MMTLYYYTAIRLLFPQWRNDAQELSLAMDSIPIKFPEIYEGFAEAEGVLRISSDALTLEYQVKDNLIGIMKSGVLTAAIPFERIDEVDFRSNFIRTRLNIRVDSMQVVEDVPGAKQGKVSLKIPRRYRKEAAVIAHEASIRSSQSKLDRLESDADSL